MNVRKIPLWAAVLYLERGAQVCMRGARSDALARRKAEGLLRQSEDKQGRVGVGDADCCGESRVEVGE